MLNEIKQKVKTLRNMIFFSVQLSAKVSIYDSRIFLSAKITQMTKDKIKAEIG